MKNLMVDLGKISWMILTKSMADPEKNYIVDPDTARNYTIPNSVIPSTFPLTLPGQAK